MKNLLEDNIELMEELEVGIKAALADEAPDAKAVEALEEA